MSAVLALIRRKREGGELAAEEIDWLLSGYLADEVDDAQMAALLMAGVINGFSDAEAVALTESLVATGRSVDLSMLSGPTVDKHSTGGVGDAATLVVAPLLAAAGNQVAKVSGRGLGHTGGTLDKLESIPGVEVELSTDRFRGQVERLGLAVAAAGEDLVPGDRQLYTLRDVTGTVEDPALIASSVMSKKLVGGARHILLDVKVGTGAFLPALAEARALAERCVAIGRAHGRATAALLTQMDEPLAPAVGNALEVAAAIEVLQGTARGRLRELSVELAAFGHHLCGPDLDASRRLMGELLDTGEALETFRAWITAQDGDARVADRPWDVLPVAPVIESWNPPPGMVQRIDTRRVGEIAAGLGAGRARLGDRVDPAVGLEFRLRTGRRTDGDGAGVRIHARSAQDAATAARGLDQAVTVGEGSTSELPLLLGAV